MLDVMKVYVIIQLYNYIYKMYIVYDATLTIQLKGTLHLPSRWPTLRQTQGWQKRKH